MHKHTFIIFRRTDLFEVCKLGVVPKYIGSLWCEGMIPTKKLHTLPIPYRTEKETYHV